MMRPKDLPSSFPLENEDTLLAGHFDEPEGYVAKRPRGMNDWLVTFTLGGEGFYRIPGREEARVRAGDVALLKPGTPHEYGTSPGERWHFVWAHFSPRMIEAGLLPQDEPLDVQRVESGHVRKRILRAFRRILADSRERGDYWQELCVGALREALLLVAQRRRNKRDARVEEALRLLSIHMREPVRIEALARAVRLSPSRLSHLFKEQTGESIVDALNGMRIRQAALLLEHTGRTASEVSYDVGYHNYNHFINQFRKRYGLSPSAYQKQKRPQGISPADASKD